MVTYFEQDSGVVQNQFLVLQMFDSMVNILYLWILEGDERQKYKENKEMKMNEKKQAT